MNETKRHTALVDIYSPQELDAISRHKEMETHELDLALGISGISNKIGSSVTRLEYLKEQGDFLGKSLLYLIKGIGFIAHNLIRAKEEKDIINKINGKSFTFAHGKLEKITHDSLPELFPAGEMEKWPRSVVFTANSSLTSPALFADKVRNAAHMANIFHGEKSKIAGLHDEDVAGKTVALASYSSKANVFLNIENNVRRYHEIRESAGQSLIHIDPASKEQATFLINFISLKDAKGRIVTTDAGQTVLRKDAAQILERFIGYGYSGSATKNHDAVRLVRDMIEHSMFAIETAEGRVTTSHEHTKMIGGITLISAGGPNLTFTNGHAVEPKCYAFVSEEDIAALFAGGKIFKDNSAIIVHTDSRNLHGHSEFSYIEAIKKYFTQQRADPGRH